MTPIQITKALTETLEDIVLRCQSIGLDPNKYSVVINARKALEQEKQNEFDLREMKHYYGGWEELRKVIEVLEESDDEAAYERHCNDY